MPIQPRADGSAAEREFFQNRDRFLRAFARISDLLRVSGKFLTESDRGRIHQMGATDLDDLPKFLALCIERAVQFFQRRQKARSSTVPPR